METGKKGNEAGIVYMPYLMSPKPIIIEGNFAPRKMIKSRYATTMISGKYFDNISCTHRTTKEEKEINRTYSELDPYGEEDWEN